MSENQWIVELLPIPVAYDRVYEMIKKDHPDLFDVWKPQKNLKSESEYGKDYPPCDFQSALERAINTIRDYSLAHMHVRVRNLDTGEIIPGEALGT